MQEIDYIVIYNDSDIDKQECKSEVNYDISDMNKTQLGHMIDDLNEYVNGYEPLSGSISSFGNLIIIAFLMMALF